MNVLFPVDGSDRSLQTIRIAGAFLDRAHARITLITIITPIVLEMPVATLEADITAADALLCQARRLCEEEGFAVAGVEHVVAYDAADAITGFAREHKVDLIVIGSHGYRGLARLVMGSVSEAVFRQAPCPVMVIRNDGSDHTVQISHFEQAGLRQADS